MGNKFDKAPYDWASWSCDGTNYVNFYEYYFFPEYYIKRRAWPGGEFVSQTQFKQENWRYYLT